MRRPADQPIKPSAIGEELLYGTPLRRRRFTDLMARLPEREIRAFWLGFLIADGRLDMADVGPSTLPPASTSDDPVAEAARLSADEVARPPKPTGSCHTCGDPLPPPDPIKGGRPPLYCPGGGCAPSRPARTRR